MIRIPLQCTCTALYICQSFSHRISIFTMIFYTLGNYRISLRLYTGKSSLQYVCFHDFLACVKSNGISKFQTRITDTCTTFNWCICRLLHNRQQIVCNLLQLCSGLVRDQKVARNHISITCIAYDRSGCAIIRPDFQLRYCFALE